MPKRSRPDRVSKVTLVGEMDAVAFQEKIGRIAGVEAARVVAAKANRTLATSRPRVSDDLARMAPDLRRLAEAVRAEEPGALEDVEGAIQEIDALRKGSGEATP